MNMDKPILTGKMITKSYLKVKTMITSKTKKNIRLKNKRKENMNVYKKKTLAP